MTETVTSTSGPGRPEPATERHLLVGALRTLRADLVTGAFAFRPVPTADTERGGWLLLPRPARSAARRLPQATMLFVALCVALTAYVDEGSGAFLAGIGVLVTAFSLFRPVGAWWISLVCCLAPAAFGGSSYGLGAHCLVMAVVAFQSRPRVAFEVWFLSLLVGLWGSPVSTGMDGTVAAFFVLTALLLIAIVALRGWQRARGEVAVKEAEVAVKEEVTLVERSRRTLLEERTTIARELHDVVAHHMSVVAIQAEAAPYRVEQAPPELEAAFVTIRENAVAALTELRRVLGVVRSEDYEVPDAPQPTLAALDGLLANVAEAGVRAEKVVTGAVREFPQGVELSAYRIVQEALSNALRHAPGAPARVELSYVLGGLGLRVVNGAPTQEPRPSAGAGHGLTGMRERVAMLDGVITTGPTGDGGFEVSVFLPSAPEEKPEAPFEDAPAAPGTKTSSPSPPLSLPASPYASASSSAGAPRTSLVKSPGRSGRPAAEGGTA
ncbi:sensor histidine kinase [Streptomyces sp. NPDC007088]|uniref:sensor histidine kinase n=1 Tax=Streptomyces sp. NPDC007088 TaxID=3364773 RepID=UPI0036A76EA0